MYFDCWVKAPKNSGPTSSRALVVVVVAAEWRRTRRHRNCSCSSLCICYIVYYEQRRISTNGSFSSPSHLDRRVRDGLPSVSLTWTHCRRRCRRLVWPWIPRSYHPRYGIIIIHPVASGSRPASAPSSSSFRAVVKVKIPPTAGTLVDFDAVTIPDEVFPRLRMENDSRSQSDSSRNPNKTVSIGTGDLFIHLWWLDLMRRCHQLYCDVSSCETKRNETKRTQGEIEASCHYSTRTYLILWKHHWQWHAKKKRRIKRIFNLDGNLHSIIAETSQLTSWA